VRAAQKLLGVPVCRLLAGECLGRGWWWRESKESNMPPFRLKCTKMVEKRAVCPNVLAYKLLKTPFFAQKYLTRYTPEMFLRNTLI
jgi:hypothetical protein